jgi:inner membrane protein
MPTALSHPAVPLALGLGLGSSAVPRRLLAAGAVASALPDADVLAFRFGIPYAHPFGHRGFTHSLAFAAAVALAGAAAARVLRVRPRAAAAFLFAATASHPLLDAMTDGGLGVALAWPFSAARWFAPFRPIAVAPFTAARLLSSRGLEIAVSELRWVWLPAAALAAALAFCRTRAASLAARRR